jgi:hypothetical protein
MYLGRYVLLNNKMGSICSHDTTTTLSMDDDTIKKESDRYQRRKQNNFRDSGLDRHIQACRDQKKQLRKVQRS